MKWIKVVDELPAMDEPVFLWDGVRMWKGGRSASDEGLLWGNTYGDEWYNFSTGKWMTRTIEADDDYRPTHWMPRELPLPPGKDE